MEFRKATSLIDLIIAIAIIALLFGGVYLVYFSIISAATNVGARTAASEAIGNELEMIRNLPYADVGTVGGIPAGVIPQNRTSTINNFTIALRTTVFNIHDPYDAASGSVPNADYKLVTVTASCPTCVHFVPMGITTTVAPPNLQAAAAQGGVIIVNVLDGNGIGVPGAEVQVVNASVTPSIDLTDFTNASGILELLGVPTSTQGYYLSATKPGWSLDQTYAPGSLGSSTPVSPNVTVASQTISSVSFSIDALSQLTVQTLTDRCVSVGSEPFTVTGSKLIGTSPDIFKFSTSSETNASGTVTFSPIEWDSYNLALADAARDVAGTIPFNPVAMSPSSSRLFQFILRPAANPSLLVTVQDAATGAGIPNATATVSSNGYSAALVTSHAVFSQTDWSGGQYASQSGGINANVSGALSLALNASGTYNTGSTEWLISNTFDVGGTSSTFNTISSNPASEPPSTGAGSLEFQVAANNDNATWHFIGPDGTANTYFTTGTSTLPASLAGNRYFRYEVFMSTQDTNNTPTLDSVTFDFTANCVPPAQVLFTNLPTGSYTVDVQAPNYQETTSSVSIGAGEQSTTIQMAHL
ncbi:MAG: hypothetical protein KGJ13_01275 [Patescibacteria group bacterium]|nr:hypothetical protein [Patescibacteria group bacterium]